MTLVAVDYVRTLKFAPSGAMAHYLVILPSTRMAHYLLCELTNFLLHVRRGVQVCHVISKGYGLCCELL